MAEDKDLIKPGKVYQGEAIDNDQAAAEFYGDKGPPYTHTFSGCTVIPYCTNMVYTPPLGADTSKLTFCIKCGECVYSIFAAFGQAGLAPKGPKSTT